jgi:hypothetical protein
VNQIYLSCLVYAWYMMVDKYGYVNRHSTRPHGPWYCVAFFSVVHIAFKQIIDFFW